ncbi:hypothetical protein LTR02_017710 [Friedmanniomyces endolithicus]|nr:hypothetical protein LTR02_017710 [Friedmanniomyces endolithicus]
MRPPCAYNDDSHIPFASDGNAPLIRGPVEKVRGTVGRFTGIKAVRKTIIITNATASTKRLLAQEAKTLYFARHQHVVHLIHTYFQEMDDTGMKFAVIMERADGDLHHHLRPTSPCVQWFGCLVGVIHHIHALGIRHRDIKPTNVFIKGGRILLADFGISQMGLGKTIPTKYEHRNAARTRQYCAPEVDQGSTRGRAADIFSLGAVFLEMLTALCYPDQMKQSDGILKPTKQIHSSYALEGNNISRNGTLALVTILLEPRGNIYLVDVTKLGREAFTTAGARNSCGEGCARLLRQPEFAVLCKARRTRPADLPARTQL